jgi:hypothetical protein
MTSAVVVVVVVEWNAVRVAYSYHHVQNVFFFVDLSVILARLL